MSFFCHQVSYTTDARHRLLHDPQDRFEAIRAPIEKLGGRVQSSFFLIGPFDVLVISEFPDDVSAAAISVAFSDGGAIASIKTFPVHPLSEVLDNQLDSPPQHERARHSNAFAATSGR
jgi:uncharacterized protein with GYD domain